MLNPSLEKMAQRDSEGGDGETNRMEDMTVATCRTPFFHRPSPSSPSHFSPYNLNMLSMACERGRLSSMSSGDGELQVATGPGCNAEPIFPTNVQYSPEAVHNHTTNIFNSKHTPMWSSVWTRTNHIDSNLLCRLVSLYTLIFLRYALSLTIYRQPQFISIKAWCPNSSCRCNALALNSFTAQRVLAISRSPNITHTINVCESPFSIYEGVGRQRLRSSQ